MVVVFGKSTPFCIHATRGYLIKAIVLIVFLSILAILKKVMVNEKLYKINDLRAISETLDGETIVINLETGNYYSMNETGTIVWNFLQTPRSPKQIAGYFIPEYGISADAAEKAVSEFILSLMADGLVIETDTVISAPIEASGNPNLKKEYAVPAIQKYDDMQEMLLADPIHDVDAAGWPTLKKSA